MPEGPVFVSHYRAIEAFMKEVIIKQPHIFKIACLQHLLDLFPDGTQPLFAGFGNRETDARSYRFVNMNPY